MGFAVMNVSSLQDTQIFALKGVAAYDFHARELGYADPEVEAFYSKALFSTLTNVNFDLNRYVDLVLECGKINYQAMEVLSKAHVEHFGIPSPAKVNRRTRKGHGD